MRAIPVAAAMAALIHVLGGTIPAAAETTVGGALAHKAGVALDDGSLAISRTSLRLNLTAQPESGEGPEFRAEGRLRNQGGLHLDHPRDADIRRLTLDWRTGDWLWSAGRQLVTWGKSDGFRVLDAVSPYDYSEFVLGDMTESRKPLAMLRAEWRGRPSDTLQVLVIPEHRPNTLPSAGSRFAPAFDSRGLSVRADIKDDPFAARPSDWQYGAKWEHNDGGVGFTANYLYRWSPSRSYVLGGPFRPTTGRYPREHLLGGSVDLSVEEWVLRGEGIWLPHTDMPARGPFGVPEYRSYEQLSGVVGLERFFGDWFVSAQAFATRLIGPPLEPPGHSTQIFYTLLVERSFDQDRYKAHLFTVWDPTGDGLWIAPKLTRDIGNGFEAAVGADILLGSDRSAFGRLNRQTRVTGELRYAF